MHGQDSGQKLASLSGGNSLITSFNERRVTCVRNEPSSGLENEFTTGKSCHFDPIDGELGEYCNCPQHNDKMLVKGDVRNHSVHSSSSSSLSTKSHYCRKSVLPTLKNPKPEQSMPTASCTASSSSENGSVHDNVHAHPKCNSSAPATTIPTIEEKKEFRRSLDSATNLLFHRRTGLPLSSSPAPMRKSGTCFDFDSSLTSVNAIKKALFEKEPDPEAEQLGSNKSNLSASAPTTTSCLLGNFEESVLNGRIEPASTVQGFTVEIGASGSFCPNHLTLPVTVFFYTLQDTDKISSPYLGHISLGKKGYHVPRKGTVQVTLFNPHRTIVKMFVVLYDLSDMPPNSRTFVRQRTLFMPIGGSEYDPDSRKWLRYLIHLRFCSSKSGRITLHTDIRIIVFRKHDLDVATINGPKPYELRSFTQYPVNPKYSVYNPQ